MYDLQDTLIVINKYVAQVVLESSLLKVTSGNIAKLTLRFVILISHKSEECQLIRGVRSIRKKYNTQIVCTFL